MGRNEKADLSFLDRSEILETVFPVAYSPYLTGYLETSSDFPAYPDAVEL